jgi:hypothetical protein
LSLRIEYLPFTITTDTEEGKAESHEIQKKLQDENKKKDFPPRTSGMKQDLSFSVSIQKFSSA